MFSNLGVMFPDFNNLGNLMKEDGGIENFIANTVIELLNTDGINGDLVVKLIGESVSESESYLDKLTKERVELLNKIDKLIDFINQGVVKGINPEQINLLNKQLKHMTKYKDVLSKRIELM